VWTPSGSLGHVQGGQFGGYLFPMGPFFAGLHAIGVSPWLIDRLWLGLLLALSAWGVVRLMDAVLQDRYGSHRGVAHLAAGAIFVLNPYVVVFANRTSVTLLGYAALPWLLLAVHRGLRTPGRWWWPAAFALLVTATGGGVNAAVTGWILLGPLLLFVYEIGVVRVPWRDARGFAWRAAVATLGASLWWIGPIFVQSLYGIDFLKFTEQPGTIWGTTSLPESLRLMGYWLSYIDIGFTGTPRLFFDDAHVLLFSVPVVAATLLVPALALAGFGWTRRWRYGPFFLALCLLGLLLMVAGFPEGTPLRRGLTFVYNHVSFVQFLRTTYKAGPLVALALAVLGGAAAAEAWRRVRGPARPLLAAGAAVLLALAVWPLTTGRAIDHQVTWKAIPAAWTKAAGGLDRTLPRNTRAVVMPGQLFAFYRWGGTVDSILPALTKRPVAVRHVVPYADLHAIDLLWTVDSLVQQQRTYPGQLRPLLGLLGAGALVVGSDDDLDRSGAVHPVDAARALDGQGFARPDQAYGPIRRLGAPPGELGEAAALPEVRRYDLHPARPLVRVEPAGPATVVDGSAEALTGLAALGALPADRPLFYAADRTPAQIRAAAAQGAEVVVTDTNRRRIFAAARLAENAGPTLAAADPLAANAAELNPFAARGRAAQTLAVYRGARYVRSLQSPGFSLFPEHRPFAAFDGSPSTAWLADRTLTPAQRWIEIGFDAPRDVDHVDVLPYDDERAVVDVLEVAGRQFRVHPGWNRLALHLRGVRSLRLRIAKTHLPHEPGGAGGLAEVRIPGVSVSELLRPPVLAEDALNEHDLSRTPLAYVLARTTGDAPLRRAAVTGPQTAQEARNRRDGEAAIARLIDPPAARTWRLDAWTAPAPSTADSLLDRLAGLRSAVRYDSSSRFENQPRYRASGAFDAAGGRAWVTDYIIGRPAWIGWTTPTPLTVSRLRLQPTRLHVRFPARVRLAWPGGATPVLAVGPGGDVALPRAVRARSFRIDVVDARFPAGTSAAQRKRRALGVGEIDVPGLPGVRVPTSGPVRSSCALASAELGGRTIGLRPSGTVGDLDAGRPLRAQGCGPPVSLAAGPQELRSAAGPFSVDILRLRSPAPAGAVATTGGGRVIDPGHQGRGRYTGVRLATQRTGWLVLGESFNRGWRASCDGRDLGRPSVIDGYANGWPLRRACRAASFTFAPGTVVDWGYWASVIACLALVGVLLLRRPGRELQAPNDGVELPVADRPDAWPLPQAALGGVAAGAVLGFAFAVRAAPVIAVAVAVILWRGLGARVLTAAAAALLVIAVPVLDLLLGSPDLPNRHFNYPVDKITAHWVTVAAIVLLIAALWRTLRGAGRPRPGGQSPDPPPAAAVSTARAPRDAPGPAPPAVRR